MQMEPFGHNHLVTLHRCYSKKCLQNITIYTEKWVQVMFTFRWLSFVPKGSVAAPAPECFGANGEQDIFRGEGKGEKCAQAFCAF